MVFGPDVIFAAGMARPSPATPIAVQYDLLLVVFAFRWGDGIILDAEANMVCDVTTEYLRQRLVGRCIYTDLDLILQEIRTTFIGVSRQALLVCLKDAYDKLYERSERLPEAFQTKRGEQARTQTAVRNIQKFAIDKQSRAEYDGRTEHLQIEGAFQMKTLPSTAICVVGLSKTGSRNPITKVHQSLIASLIVDAKSGEIYAAEFNTVCKLTNLFISALIVGKDLLHDMDALSQAIQTRYLGDSRRAIVFILKDAQNKLVNYMETAALEGR